MVVINGVISRATILISLISGLITTLKTTHEPKYRPFTSLTATVSLRGPETIRPSASHLIRFPTSQKQQPLKYQ